LLETANLIKLLEIIELLFIEFSHLLMSFKQFLIVVRLFYLDCC